MFGQVGAQQCHGVVAERDVASLAALAGQHRQGRGFQADVTHGQVGEFGNPRGGVVEGGQQSRVTTASPGGPIGCGEQTAGLLDGEVIDARLGLAFGGDGKDVLTAGHSGRLLGLQPPEERADRGQALVAGRDAVVPFGFQPVEEPGDRVGVDAVEGELVGLDGSAIAEPGDQQLEGVAVGGDRVG